MLRGIYGDASKGAFGQLFDNITGASKNAAINAINNSIDTNIGIAGSN
jgi:hypothetical protein